MQTTTIVTKRVLMTFTGGIDSTYLFINTLHEGHNVDLLYIQLPGLHPLKIVKETESVQALIEMARKKFPERSITLITLTPTFDRKESWSEKSMESGFQEDSEHAHTQQPAWLFFLAMMLRSEHDEVMTGFQVSDSIMMHLEALQSTWQGLLNISKRYFRPLLFPLKYINKLDILMIMPPEIARLTWSCQLPVEHKGKIYACGVCQSCVEILGVLSYSGMSPVTRQAYLKGRFVKDPYRHLQKGYKPPTVPKNKENLLDTITKPEVW